jgi:hydrogenase nickel incorporation protein HypA/HybF
MHEASTAQALADVVLRETSERKAARVLRVEVEIGEMSFLEPDQLSFWLEHLFRDTPAQGAEVSITTVKPQVRCEKCGYTGGIETHEDPAYHLMLPRFTCPRCGAAELTVERGRECILRRVEMEISG